MNFLRFLKRPALLSGSVLEGSHEVDDVRHGFVDSAAEDARMEVHGAALHLGINILVLLISFQRKDAQVDS
jgi:hypothetical protein